MGVLRIVFGDPKCPRHGQRVPEGQACPKCARAMVPGTKKRSSVKKAPTNSHAPYKCPHAGCNGVVRGGFCPLSDLHR